MHTSYFTNDFTEDDEDDENDEDDEDDENCEDDENDENGEDWLLSRITLDKKCILFILHKILPNGRWQTIACQITRQRCTKCHT